MLWKRKSKEKDAIYIDIFEDVRNLSVYQEATTEIPKTYPKDDELALFYRKEGNGQFKKKHFDEAMIFYNKCLCFASSGSENMSFGYANRAFCCLVLELYEQCLLDIELAKKSNYPEHLLPKLEKRRINCLNKLATAAKREEYQPKLSFPADEQITSMANALKIQKSDRFGRHVVAQCDIKVDQTIIIEKPMIKLLRESEYKRCVICLKKNQTLVPCTRCTKAMFCSESCCDNQFHKYECNIKYIKYFDGLNGVNNQTCIKFLIRMALVGLNIFPSINEMMRSVNACIANNQSNEIAFTDGSPMSNFLTFLQLHHAAANEMVFDIYRLIACIAYDILMTFPEVKEKFVLISTQRFLMHLLTHFTGMFKANNVLLQEYSKDVQAVLKNEGLESFGAGLFNIGSYLNHACMPNVLKIANNNFCMIKTIRPIKKGEQICMRYSVKANQSTSERRAHLLEACGFLCNCELCVSNGPAIIENFEMKSEFQYLSLQMVPFILSPHIDADALKALKNKWFKFLDKYREIPTTECIIFAYENFKLIFAMELVDKDV